MHFVHLTAKVVYYVSGLGVDFKPIFTILSFSLPLQITIFLGGHIQVLHQYSCSNPPPPAYALMRNLKSYNNFATQNWSVAKIKFLVITFVWKLKHKTFMTRN